ncbi:hypothetical protein ASG72_08700 [Bosea sp. Leaf344]|uniref:ribonuclease activity regulator RraA n=1 Tax=Bosea sp. Leaf344 TaxID=1736346 RepID=UPI0006F23AFE|nr:ribonuclease activity regulator RraA [Bosea sp. Leaf344]KQU51605.1 hypothetical protein ASG72_08700 [Bosea sp. Leaf344]
MTHTLTDDNRRKLRRVSTATLTTALFKRGFRNVFIQDVRPLSPLAESMVGEAFTLRYIPAREDLDHLGAFEGTGHPQRRAIEDCPPGHVMVIDSRKDARAASAGGILVSRLKQRGVAGIVSDGGFRDSPEIAAMEFPAFHNRPSAPTNLIRHHALDINAPIACGDVAVYPGDIMVGDSEGVCVVPAHLANEVAEEAYEQTAYEDFVAERVRAGQGIFGLYPANAETKAAFQAWRPSWR